MYVHESVTPDSLYSCECGGVLEVEATAWINLSKGADGKPELEVFGFSEGDYAVKCAECGKEHTGTALGRAVGGVIYGDGGKDWFRG
ncbi:hypothetical protein [Streptomyces sp. Da 82-17]|uniref:hypothetical protein n=1 Tax=Streptomyces sp. Da 82-17 TaxID=3377116 RepID=UPI0038D3A39B